MQLSIFYTFLLCIVGLLTRSTITSAADCPYGWVKQSKSCYFAATAWTKLTYYDSMAFCQSFGAHLVEFNSVAEYNYIISTGAINRKTDNYTASQAANVSANNYPWWNGPWIGLMKPYEGFDKSWVLPSLRTVSKDSNLNRIIDAAALRDKHRCGGLNRRGSGFGFWDCGGQDSWTSEPQKGSPWCELDLDD